MGMTIIEHFTAIFMCLAAFGLSSGTDLNVHLGFVLDDGSIITVSDIDKAVSAVNEMGFKKLTVTYQVVKIREGHFAEAELCHAASSGVTTAVSLTACRILQVVKSTFNTFQIPVINVGPDPCNVGESCFFSNVEFEKANMAEFARDIAVMEKWTRVNILYDSTVSFDILDDIQTLLHDKGISTTLVNLDLAVDLGVSLRRIYNVWEKSYWNYMIAASEENTLKILDKALTLSMREKGKTWIILNSSVAYSSLESRFQVLDNIGVIGEVERRESWLCQPRETALQKLIETIVIGHIDTRAADMWANQTIQNCGGRWPCGRDLMTFTRAKFRYLSKNCTSYTQYELHASLMMDGGMRLSKTAVWNKRDHILLNTGCLFPNTKNGFNGMNFRVTTLPYSYFQQNTTYANGTSAMLGLVPDIMNILARSLNFTVTWIQPADGYWGAPVDGTWNGMIAQVMAGDADFAAAGHTITAARSEVVDFADAFLYESCVIMVKTPGTLSRLMVYLAPLHLWVWVCTILAIPVCGFLLWALMRVSPFYKNQELSAFPETALLFRLFPCLWYTFGCLWNQGQDTTPRAPSARFLLAAWWLCVVIIIATYSGNLIAFLTVTKVTLPISSLSQLASQTDIKYGTVRGTALWTLLETSQAGAPARIWQNMDKEDQPHTYEGGKEKVLTDNYALITEKSFFEGAAADNCNFTSVPKEEFFYSSYGFAIAKGSPLTRIFSEGINAMSESGVLEKLRKDWTPRQRCTGLTYSQAKPASLADTQGAFISLGIGIAAGLVVLVFEVGLHCCRRRQPKREDSDAGSEGSYVSNNNVNVDDEGSSSCRVNNVQLSLSHPK